MKVGLPEVRTTTPPFLLAEDAVAELPMTLTSQLHAKTAGARSAILAQDAAALWPWSWLRQELEQIWLVGMGLRWQSRL